MLISKKVSIATMKVWSTQEEAENLKRLLSGIKNKAKFAKEHRIPGGASMLSQHESGHRPIGLDAAMAYAKGLGVPLSAISPRLAIKVEEVSSLGSTHSGKEVSIKEKESPLSLNDFASSIQHCDDVTLFQVRGLLEWMMSKPERASEVVPRISALLTREHALA